MMFYWKLFIVFFRLGLTAFGGPVAHLAYFHEAFVRRRQWLSEQQFADLVALCQFLPGPASSQVNFSIGYMRGGYIGALIAWAAFTLPSALVLIALAVGLSAYGEVVPPTALQGLKLVAVAVVAVAVWGMGQKLCKGHIRMSLMFAAAMVALLWSGVWGQISVIVGGAILGMALLKNTDAIQTETASELQPLHTARMGTTAGLPSSAPIGLCIFFLALFVVLLFALPWLATQTDSFALQQFAAFYKTGALVFGGGHVVLPLLQAEVTTATAGAGWVDTQTFLAGYGATQAVPGPLFTFSAFLGASMEDVPNGWLGGLWCLLAIYIPSFLLVLGVLPFWQTLRQNRWARAGLNGVNAAVVGVLLATLYDPVWTLAVHDASDIAWVLLAFAALYVWKLPPWLVVISGGLLGAATAWL